MNAGKSWRIFLALGATFALVVIIVFAFTQLKAQDQQVMELAERLKQRGVPVKHVIVLSRVPYEIEIALQSSSEDDRLSMEDNWFMQLAQREAVLAYRFAVGLDSYLLKIYNAKGALIYSVQTYLHSRDLSQQLVMPGKPGLNDQETKEIIASKLQLSGLSLDVLEVNPEDSNGNDTPASYPGP